MPIGHQCDIAIIGAGPAGVMASVAAARAGARVILFERSNLIGGAVTAAMHRSICGLYSSKPDDAEATLNDGLQRELVARMRNQSPREVRPVGFGLAWVLEFPPTAWLGALGDVLHEARVDRRMSIGVESVVREGRRVVAIHVGGQRIEPAAVIDCTGGKMLELAGEDVVQPIDADRNLAGYAVRLVGLSGDVEMLRLQTPYVLARAVDAGRLPKLARFTVFHPGPGAGDGVIKLAAEGEGVAETAIAVIDELRRELPALADATILERSRHAVARDGRRLRGVATVTEDDVLSARRCNGDVVHAWWPIERWSANDGPSYQFGPPREHYDIPLDALRSATIENLFAAGMCGSATQGAMASMRVSGICLATGALAGQRAAQLVAAGASLGPEAH